MSPDDLARLHAAAFAGERPWGAAEFAGLLAAPGSLLLGDARAALLARVTLDDAEVLTLATEPVHRRRGLARGLLDRFHPEAARRGATRAILEVAEDNGAARLLYERAGYGEVGRRAAYSVRTHRSPVAALVLARPLP